MSDSLSQMPTGAAGVRPASKQGRDGVAVVRDHPEGEVGL